MTDIAIVQSLPEKQWRDFVDQQPNGNIFHTPEMFQVFRHAHHHQPELWAAVRGDQILAILLPVRVNIINGILKSFTTRAVAYGSVLYRQDEDEKNGLTMLLQVYSQAVKRKALFIELRNLYDSSLIQPVLDSCHYSFQEHLNFLVDISLPVDQIWENINKSAQKNITKALKKHQFEIVEAQNISQIELCYEILKKTYAKAHVPLADYSLFEAAFNILYPKGMIKFLLGRAEGKDIAASVILLYKNVIYGWYRGFDRAYSSYLPNDLMVWNTLQWGAGNHYCTFDFGGAGKPDEKYGPRQFKAKFGGKLVNYGRNICILSSNLLYISKWGYKFFRYFPQNMLSNMNSISKGNY